MTPNEALESARTAHSAAQSSWMAAQQAAQAAAQALADIQARATAVASDDITPEQLAAADAAVRLTTMRLEALAQAHLDAQTAVNQAATDVAADRYREWQTQAAADIATAAGPAKQALSRLVETLNEHHGRYSSLRWELLEHATHHPTPRVRRVGSGGIHVDGRFVQDVSSSAMIFLLASGALDGLADREGAGAADGLRQAARDSWPSL